MNQLTATRPTPVFEHDVQAEPDTRGIAIERVGVRRLRYPMSIVRRDAAPQSVIGSWELATDLSASQRGTHMSRFVEALDDWSTEPFDARRIQEMVADIAGRLDAATAHASASFTLFLERRAPVSGLTSKLGIDCRLTALYGDTSQVIVRVRVPVTSLCPCSKEISDYGAHSQRGYVTIDAFVDPAFPPCFEDLIDVAETSGSAPIYPLLKRADERFVTMQAYDAPAFVEDLARAVSLALMADQRVAAFSVEAENEESIHDHAAVAIVRWEREA